jgi:hypothetical protein
MLTERERKRVAARQTPQDPIDRSREFGVPSTLFPFETWALPGSVLVMLRKPLIGLVALSCIALAGACSEGSSGVAGNTEINLLISDPASEPDELAFAVDSVNYAISCFGRVAICHIQPGNPPSLETIWVNEDALPAHLAHGDTVGFCDEPGPPGGGPPVPDPLNIYGSFEIDESRDPPVWQAVMDLPPGTCTITLFVMDPDGEVVCTGIESLPVFENGDPSTTNKFDIVLVCSLSTNPPTGDLEAGGTFAFVIGNRCPLLVWMNSIPEVVDVASSPQTSAVQYRAWDPDNTCGDNCDPQTCDFSTNPPVCSESPYNPTDARCNPLVGGDPNNPECLDGTASGLVCTLTATPSSSGIPGGNFLDPNDGVTQLGPIMPFNLEDSLGDGSGVVVPGLDIDYLCDPSVPGLVTLTVVCSDGDEQCDKIKTFDVTCPGINYCEAEPPGVCDGSNDCMSDGVCTATCDPLCDPSINPGIPACPTGSSPADECSQCTGNDIPLAIDTACTSGGGSFCDGGGSCVECNSDLQCDSSPIDCREPSVCSGNACQARALSAPGTPCSIGACDAAGVCQFVLVDPPATTQTITLGCTSDVTTDVSIVPFGLTVDPDGVESSSPVTATLDGVAELPEAVLDLAQTAMGGVQEVNIIDLAATVQLRSGGAGAAVTLGLDAVPYVCRADLVTSCDPANDDSVGAPGNRGNSDCVPTPTDPTNPCGRFLSVPTSFNCLDGGTCDMAGKMTQCVDNGFCVSGPLPLPLAAVSGASYTADPAGTMLFGWDDVTTGATLNPDGTYALPPAVFLDPIGANGIRVNLGGLSAAIECTMAVDANDPVHGVGVPGEASPSPDAVLLGFPIQVPPP